MRATALDPSASQDGPIIDAARAVDPRNDYQSRGRGLWLSSSPAASHPANAPKSAAATTSSASTLPSPVDTASSIPIRRMTAQVASAAAGATATVSIRRRVREVMRPSCGAGRCRR
jgi:hypothetical protein